MEASSKVTTKSFVSKLRDIVKAKYKESVISLVSFIVIAIAVIVIVAFAGYEAFAYVTQKLVMLMYTVMYGMTGAVSASSIAIGVVIFLAALALFVAAIVFIQFFAVAIQYEFQDTIQKDSKKISLKGIWAQFRIMNKNQMWRLFLYSSLFIGLWTLPTNILELVFSSNTILAIIFRLLTAVITIWKTLEYAQGIFLYRAQRPKFLGQSMRHAFTASRRFMSHKKWQYLWLMIVTVVPLIVGQIIFGLITFYGEYTATYFFLYLGIILMVVYGCAYLPVLYFSKPLYFELTRSSVSIDETFEDTFKSVGRLTGTEPYEKKSKKAKKEVQAKIEPNDAKKKAAPKDTKNDK